MVLKYLDLVLLSAWSTEARGPTRRDGGLEPVVGEKGTTLRLGSPPSRRRNAWEDVWWALTLIFNNRLVDTPWEVRSVPAFSEEHPGWVPSRARFVLTSSATALVCFVLLDAIRLLAAPPEVNAVLFAPERVAFFSRLGDVSLEEVVVRYISAGMYGVVTFLFFQGVYCGMGAIMVGLGVSEVRIWRPYFGSLIESWSLRRFWG